MWKDFTSVYVDSHHMLIQKQPNKYVYIKRMLLNNLHDMFSPLLSFSFLTMRDARQKKFFCLRIEAESVDVWGCEG